MTTEPCTSPALPVARLRARFDAFRTRTPNPDLRRDLTHGWLLPALLSLDACLWHRWDYWLLCHEHAQEHDGALPDAPIPRLDILAFPHAATRKMLEASLDCVPTHGSWRTWGNSLYFDYFLSWLLYGFGHKGHSESPLEPSGCAGASDRLYQAFCLDALLLWPYDYWGDLLQESSYGKGQGFYPTPHTLCEAMARILMSEDRDCRNETVCDPCVGTGRMLLHASNFSLRLYGMDIDATLCKATLVNGYLYAPWLARPLPHLDPELAALENLSAAANGDKAMPMAAALSEAVARTAPPHQQSRLADTEHDGAGQRHVSPVLKRRRRQADPSQGTLFD